MHVVILGCGRVGSALALELERFGHSVAVIDQDAGAFHRLTPAFTGRTVVGVGFDRDTLIEADIEKADAFASVSSGDNTNIISARVAREIFDVPRVVARIYDPRRAEVYERLGIPTVATVRWTRDQTLARLLPDGVAPEWADASGAVVLVQLEAGAGWAGHPVRELEQAAAVRVACVTRFGEGLVPDARTVVQDGDVLHVAVPRRRVAEAQAVANGNPPRHA